MMPKASLLSLPRLLFIIRFVLLHPTQAWLLSSKATFFSTSSLAPPSHDRDHKFVRVLFMGIRGKKIRREKRKALKEATPPVVHTPYGKIRISRPPRLCTCCNGKRFSKSNMWESNWIFH
jgi:hypothetical protein